MSKSKKLFALAAFLVGALLGGVPSAAAYGSAYLSFGHGTPWYDSNNIGTNSPGFLSGYSPSNNLDILASGEYIQWDQGHVDWIQQHTEGNTYQPAIVYHVIDRTSNNDCADGYYDSAWSNLPGYNAITKSACYWGDSSEIRFTVGLPWSLQAGTSYNTQVVWHDTEPQFKHELTIDNYWWKALGAPWDQPVINRDRMTKFCFYFNNVSAPGAGFVCPQ